MQAHRFFLVVTLAFSRWTGGSSCLAQAPNPDSKMLAPVAASAPTAVPSLVPYSGMALTDDGKPLAGDKNVTFLIYKEESGGEPAWTESQSVAVDSFGHLRGAARSGEFQWLDRRSFLVRRSALA